MYLYQRVVVWVCVGLIALSMILFFGAAVAVAYGGNETEPETETHPEGEYIDQNTQLLNSSYSERSGEATITLQSERLQEVTLSDAGAFVEGGEVEQRTVVLRPGEPTQITMPVTEANGRVGVSISTPELLYAHIIEPESYLFYEDPTWQIVQLASVMSGLGVLGAVGLDVARRKFFRISEVLKLG